MGAGGGGAARGGGGGAVLVDDIERPDPDLEDDDLLLPMIDSRWSDRLRLIDYSRGY